MAAAPEPRPTVAATNNTAIKRETEPVQPPREKDEGGRVAGRRAVAYSSFDALGPANVSSKLRDNPPYLSG